MFKKLIFTFFLFFISLIAIYPSKKENTNLMDYCYSLEKILSRNSLKKSKKVSNKFKAFARDLTLFGTNKTKGALLNEIIEQYKTSKNFIFIKYVPNKYYCLTGYWIEHVTPGIFQTIFYEKSIKRINEYKDIKKEVDEYFKIIF